MRFGKLRAMLPATVLNKMTPGKLKSASGNFFVGGAGYRGFAANDPRFHRGCSDVVEKVVLGQFYTAHEHIEGMDLIHMNGRVYDPIIGRMVQTDPFVQAPTLSLSYNRYAYVFNNPLNRIDPTGYISADGDGPEGFDEGDSDLTDGFNDAYNDARSQADNNINGLDNLWGAIRDFFTPEPVDFGLFDANALLGYVDGFVGWNQLARYSFNHFASQFGGFGLAYQGQLFDSLLNEVALSLPSLPQEVVDFGVGWGNTVSFGLGGYLSEVINGPESFNRSTDAFSYGSYAGIATGLSGLMKGAFTTVEGFLVSGISIKTPFSISVQRFGQISISGQQHWGLRLGSSLFASRTFAAIKPSWNPLTQLTQGVIPKGTSVTFGVTGPQGFRYPGGSLQFMVDSKNVANQTTKLINR